MLVKMNIPLLGFPPLQILKLNSVETGVCTGFVLPGTRVEDGEWEGGRGGVRRVLLPRPQVMTVSAADQLGPRGMWVWKEVCGCGRKSSRNWEAHQEVPWNIVEQGGIQHHLGWAGLERSIHCQCVCYTLAVTHAGLQCQSRSFCCNHLRRPRRSRGRKWKTGLSPAWGQMAMLRGLLTD